MYLYSSSITNFILQFKSELNDVKIVNLYGKNIPSFYPEDFVIIKNIYDKLEKNDIYYFISKEKKNSPINVNKNLWIYNKPIKEQNKNCTLYLEIDASNFMGKKLILNLFQLKTNEIYMLNTKKDCNDHSK